MVGKRVITILGLIYLPSKWLKHHKSGGKRKPYHKKRKSELGDFLQTPSLAHTRITDVIYNASNNELVQPKTLVNNCIILIVRTLYRPWYEAHYKKNAKISSSLKDQSHYPLVAIQFDFGAKHMKYIFSAPEVLQSVLARQIR
uniref:Uncharacterized protein n=1 Tax=Chrysemys picta bellii TaxID=8478 RepID=A0A8C3FQG0_CHRPI